jgi:hypothetical protein
MEDLLKAYNSWYAIQCRNFEEQIKEEPEDEVTAKFRYEIFIEVCKQVRDFLEDYKEGLISYLDRPTLQGTRHLHHRGKAIDHPVAVGIVWSVLTQFREYNQLSLDERGRVAGNVLDTLLQACGEEE